MRCHRGEHGCAGVDGLLHRCRDVGAKLDRRVATSATWMAAYRNPRVLLHPLPSASWGASAGWKILSIA